MTVCDIERFSYGVQQEYTDCRSCSVQEKAAEQPRRMGSTRLVHDGVPTTTAKNPCSRSRTLCNSNVDSIEVELRDFLISVKSACLILVLLCFGEDAYLSLLQSLCPSSARSVSSAVSPLPAQLVLLLQEPLDKIKEVVGKVLPLSKKRAALEEAEWEDVGGSEGAQAHELMMQCTAQHHQEKPPSRITTSVYNHG